LPADGAPAAVLIAAFMAWPETDEVGREGARRCVKLRASTPGDRPAVAYCSMEKKSWLQPRGEITNPYVAAPMRACGEFRDK
jgi:hypothetical protein